ncbi:hypothetical protein Tco_0468493 [Tanacetum coccineum]
MSLSRLFHIFIIILVKLGLLPPDDGWSCESYPETPLLNLLSCHARNWPLRVKQLAVHSAQPIVEDVHLLMAINVVSWAFVKQVIVPFPGLVQCFISFLLEVMDFFKLLSGLGWWTVPLDKGLFKEVPGIDGSWG